MSKPLAIIPARANSQGIPDKNFRALAGNSPLQRAIVCAVKAGLDPVVTSDAPDMQLWGDGGVVRWIQRHPDLASDTAAMIDVVRDVLQRIPGEPDQKVVLVQCTQPLREPKHITAALALLTPEVDSVVSVVETTSPDELLVVDENDIVWADGLMRAYYPYDIDAIPTRRQDMRHGYKRDGTCYAFHRRTIEQHGDIYGTKVRPLIIPASETVSLDTPEDWAEAERRLRECRR